MCSINDISESRLIENATNIDAFMGNFEEKYTRSTRNARKYEEHWKYTLENLAGETNFYLG